MPVWGELHLVAIWMNDTWKRASFSTAKLQQTIDKNRLWLGDDG
jgi:hypothetical protein